MNKRERLDEIRKRLIVEGRDEEEGWEIDPNILDTLVCLNALGFRTIISSCEGHQPTSEDDFQPNAGPYIDLGSQLDEEDNLSDEEMEERVKRFEKGELTEEDIALSEKQAQYVRRDQRRLLELLEQFYKNRVVTEKIRLIVSPLHLDRNSYTLSSQGAWAEYSAEERVAFLHESQAELADFTRLLWQKYFSD